MIKVPWTAAEDAQNRSQKSQKSNGDISKEALEAIEGTDEKGNCYSVHNNQKIKL